MRADDDPDHPTPRSRLLAALLLAVACVVGMPMEHAPAVALTDAPALSSSIVCEQPAPTTDEAEVAVRAVFTRSLARASDDDSTPVASATTEFSAASPMSDGASWRGPPPSTLPVC